MIPQGIASAAYKVWAAAEFETKQPEIFVYGVKIMSGYNKPTFFIIAWCLNDPGVGALLCIYLFIAFM